MSNKPIVEENIKATEELDIDSLSDGKIGEKREKPHLDGKVCFLGKPILTATGDIRPSKDGKKKMETVLFKVNYTLKDTKEQCYENYGGVTRFIRSDGTKSEPTINWKGNSWAAKLFKAWVVFKGKKIEQVSFKEFFNGLEGLQVRLKEVEVQYEGRPSAKNVIECFL